MVGPLPENLHKVEALKLIGEFLVNFELAVDTMRHHICRCFHADDSEKVMVLISEMEAMTILNATRTLYLQRFIGDSEIKIVDELFKNTIELIKARNKVIHGTWKIGGYGLNEAGEPVPLDITRHTKPVATKTGIEMRQKSMTKDQLNELVQWSEDVKVALSVLTFKFAKPHYSLNDSIKNRISKLPKMSTFFD